jgi:DNA-directed RNA polymerase subunit beta'
VPSQDIVLGLYYATREAINGKGEGMMFPDVSEVIRAYDNKEVELATRITVRIVEHPKDPDRRIRAYRQALRNHRRPRHPVRNPAQGPAVLGAEPRAEEEGNLQADQHLLPQVRPAATVVFADKLMQSGFRLATRAGISICVDDMLVPPQKATLIAAPSRKSRRSSSSTPRVW